MTRQIQRTPFGGESLGLERRLDRLRRGTVDFYESGWFQLRGEVPSGAGAETEARTFKHQLGRVPFAVDIQISESANGAQPTDGNSSATITKDDGELVVTTSLTRDLYFKVLAY